MRPGREIIGPPRSESDIKRASASFHTTSCRVKSDGAALEVTFPGLSMGIFSGDLRFTAYRGANLLRMDALATTKEEWIAYKYEAGLKGLSTDLTPRVVWRDTGGQPQQYAFGGVIHKTFAPVKAQNRLLVAEGKGASLAAFTPPHTFFFTREVDTNLGYVWYRKDAAGKFSFGIRQAEREENPQYVDNFALFNAPPGTIQQMGVYFYANADSAEATRQATDKDFLITPWEEPSAFFGGHYNIMFPKNVYWSKVRQPGQPFTENDPVYGKVYHTGSTEDVQKMLDAEGAYWYHAHPRTKGTTGYPDLILDKEWTRNDRYLGVAFKPGMGMDLSDQRMCEWRCFDSSDKKNNPYTNAGPRPKYASAHQQPS